MKHTGVVEWREWERTVQRIYARLKKRMDRAWQQYQRQQREEEEHRLADERAMDARDEESATTLSSLFGVDTPPSASTYDGSEGESKEQDEGETDDEEEEDNESDEEKEDMEQWLHWSGADADRLSE